MMNYHLELFVIGLFLLFCLILHILMLLQRSPPQTFMSASSTHHTQGRQANARELITLLFILFITPTPTNLSLMGLFLIIHARLWVY
jgi:preprotein translocase subunit SecG